MKIKSSALQFRRSSVYKKWAVHTDGQTDGQKSKYLKTPKTYSNPLKRVFRQYYFLTVRLDGRTDGQGKNYMPR